MFPVNGGRDKRSKEEFVKSHNSFNKNRELIFGYSSVLGLIVSIISTFIAFSSDLDTRVTLVIVSVCVTNVCLNILCIVLMRRYDIAGEQIRRNQVVSHTNENEINDLKKKVNDHIYAEGRISIIFHNIIHSHRDLVNKINIDLVIKKSSIREREESFRNYLIYFLSNIKDIFDLITRDACSVCIKLLVEVDSNQYNVKTYLRDPISYRDRCDIDKEIVSYPYYKNTAFNCILSPYENKNFFLNNDLLELEKQGKYKNCNQKWKSNYNACLVVPIRAVAQDSYNKNIGFLCVDNMKGGFDERITFNILAAFADLVYCLFQAIYILNKQTSSTSSVNLN